MVPGVHTPAVRLKPWWQVAQRLDVLQVRQPWLAEHADRENAARVENTTKLIIIVLILASFYFLKILVVKKSEIFLS